MQLRYWELIGRPVIATDGKNIGRLVDLTAKRRGERLEIEGLLIGPGALIRRIGFRRGRFFQHVSPQYIPWSLVERVDERIYLRVSSDELPTSDGAGEPNADSDSGRL